MANWKVTEGAEISDKEIGIVQVLADVQDYYSGNDRSPSSLLEFRKSVAEELDISYQDACAFTLC